MTTCVSSCHSVACQLNVPGGRALGRIDRHNATEARAERANHAGQPQVTNGEVVVVREDLDENRAGRREVVAGRQRRERVLGERDGIFAEDWRLVAMHFQDEIAIANGDELIQLVQHLEQVVGNPIERIGAKRAIESAPRAWLVARTHQMHAEIARRVTVGLIQRQRFLRKRHRLVEAVVARRLLGRHAVDLSVHRIDREHLCDLGVEAGLVVPHVRHCPENRMRLETGRVDGKHLGQLLPRLVGRSASR